MARPYCIVQVVGGSSTVSPTGSAPRHLTPPPPVLSHLNPGDLRVLPLDILNINFIYFAVIAPTDGELIVSTFAAQGC